MIASAITCRLPRPVLHPLDHHLHPRQLTHCQLGEGVEATGRCRKPLRHMDVALWRPRSPAEHTSVIDGGDLGGARVCRGAWRYAPLPQREVGNLAPLRRSRICRAAAFKVRPAPAGRRSYTNRHAICLNACGTEIEDIHPLTSGSAVSPPLDHHPHPRQLTHCQLGEGVEATGRCRKPLWATDGTLWRPRSPAELISVIDGGDLWGPTGFAKGGFGDPPLARRVGATAHSRRRSRNLRYEIRDTRYEIRDTRRE